MCHNTVSQCGNFRIFPPTAKIFRQIDLHYNCLVKYIFNLTKFLKKIVGEKFAHFHTVSVEITEIYVKSKLADVESQNLPFQHI